MPPVMYPIHGRRPLRQDWIAVLRRPVTHLQVLLSVALMFGGGGVGYGLLNAVVQICALAVLGLNFEGVRGFVRHAPWPVIGLVVVTLLLPIVQLVPVPAAVWMHFPGRDLVEQSYALVGNPQDMWSSWSLDPARTLTSLAGALVPATMLVLGWGLPGEDRLRLLWTLLWCAVVSVLLGVLQVSGVVPLLYETNDEGLVKVVHGLFANRNSTGIFFDVVLAVACGLPMLAGRFAVMAGRMAIMALIALGVVGTMSRSATALLIVPAAFLVLRLWATHGQWYSRITNAWRLPKWWLPGAVAILIVALGGFAAIGGGRLATTFGRFDNLQDQRPEIWKDAIDSAHRYWPMGAGTGTFDEVFQVDESLEYVTARRAGRAHNDYIEMAVESGAVAEAIAAAWLLVLAAAMWCARKRRDRWLIWGSGAGLLCFALQSSIDYPLRNQINLCVASLLFSICARAFRPRRIGGAA